ncbi:alpha/beta hydrolase [Rubellicoccus peritrichatus]|uniref:Alpha/beta hydrolase n=1 Tax=Rubellicoccus peritrichatus TaxID=3080537 RepID=A0AAQ3LG57_9BACT|nr:alpha/beta hydrolase [Puniceicoccus sp. CR14]WOO43255.1 alpha/beta hydrolase [Puniceicoccus sp. CR14]
MGFLFKVIASPLIALALLLSGCGSFQSTPEQITAVFASEGLETPAIADIQRPNGNLRFADTAPADNTKPLVIFIHGAPGSWDAFTDFMADKTLREHVRMVSVDRPGYGGSNPGTPMPSLQEQATFLSPTLDIARPNGTILVGHSLGGPVAVQMAMDKPDKVRGLILVAPSIDPQLERTKWYQYPADWLLFRWMVPEALDVTNQEILPLKGELEKQTPRWSEIIIPVIVIQGEKDTLVPPANAQYAQKMLTNTSADIRLHPELNHFIPWSAPELIKEAILDLAEREH